MDAARTSAVRDAGIVTAVVATTMASAVTASAVASTVPAATTTSRDGHGGRKEKREDCDEGAADLHWNAYLRCGGQPIPPCGLNVPGV